MVTLYILIYTYDWVWPLPHDTGIPPKLEKEISLVFFGGVIASQCIYIFQL